MSHRAIKLSLILLVAAFIVSCVIGCPDVRRIIPPPDLSSGDINLNGRGYEIADALLFSRYFVYGLGVFTINVDDQIAATDVNGDGQVLTVADLVYLARVARGIGFPEVPSSREITLDIDSYSGIISTDLPIGAAYIIVKGNVQPTLLADNASLLYNFDGTNTLILVYPDLETMAISFTGEFILVWGEILSIQTATNVGEAAKTILAPLSYKLYQNYPNPFNPTTTIPFRLPDSCTWKLTICSQTGQIVKIFEEASGPAWKEVIWDASDQASGTYFYTLKVGSFTATKRMEKLR